MEVCLTIECQRTDVPSNLNLLFIIKLVSDLMKRLLPLYLLILLLTGDSHK